MQAVRSLILLAWFISFTHAIPIISRRELFHGIHLDDDFLLFDAPAFPDPRNPLETLVNVETFASSRLGSVLPQILEGLSKLGIDPHAKAAHVEERIKLFQVAGLSGKYEKLSVEGCSGAPNTGSTDIIPNRGLSDTVVSLGHCGSGRTASATIKLDSLDKRKIGSTVYFSPDSGYGVISDIDDTIKISHVLDKTKLAEATFIDDPKPVAGMPELYSSLAKSLSDPQFIYVSGSPFQLYPFIQSFIKTTYHDASGPVLMRNLTIANPAEIIDFIRGGDSIRDYKISRIDELHHMYPSKKWLAIGDSTETDPEAYGTVFKRYSGSIMCIWIRKVEGAKNDPSRFDAAFEGVPKDKVFVYTDDQIASLSKIDVANGKCTP